MVNTIVSTVSQSLQARFAFLSSAVEDNYPLFTVKTHTKFLVKNILLNIFIMNQLIINMSVVCSAVYLRLSFTYSKIR
jgi:hypothetical protein